MTLRGHPLRQVAAYVAWLLAVGVLFDAGIYPHVPGGWTGNLVQVGAYALSVAPIVVWAPGVLRTLPAPWVQVAIGVAFVVAGTVQAGLQHAYPHALLPTVIGFLATGFGEELAFRGFIWDRLRRAGLRAPVIVAVDDLLFTGWHLVAVATGDLSLVSLISVACYGLVFSVVRLVCRNTTLPALLHAATDIAGGL